MIEKERTIIMLGIFKNQKFWCVVAGAAGVIAGEKLVKSKKAREVAVNGLAKGMKLKYDAEEAFQSIKDEAEDVCYDARKKAAQEDEAASDAADESAVKDNEG